MLTSALTVAQRTDLTDVLHKKITFSLILLKNGLHTYSYTSLALSVTVSNWKHHLFAATAVQEIIFSFASMCMRACVYSLKSD